MRLTIPICFLALITLSIPLKADNDFCGLTNTAFKPGERLTYKIFYTTIGVSLGNAGEAVFTTTLERFNGKEVYHIVAEGKSNSFYDNVFKVRDRYESFVDTATLQPYKFIRRVNEGGHKTYEDVSFVKDANTAVTNSGVYKVPSCIQDVVSAVFYARNIDFSRMIPGDTIPFDMFLDRKVNHMFIRYLGKEIIRTRYAKFRAIKFRPLLLKSFLFEGGEKMVVWVSDDPNHIALRIETPVLVGKVKVDLVNPQNLRYPLSSMISF